MSHFVGLVFGSNMEELLEPFDENKELEEYVRFTQDEAVDKVKEERAYLYEKALEAIEKLKNPETQLEKETLERCKKMVERGIGISYDEAWEEAKSWGYDIDENNNLLSTYNLDSKWDWYVIGGRWGSWLILKSEDGESLQTAACASKGEVDWDAMFYNDRIPFCFITSLGKWHESAKMGWWGMTADDKEKDEWNNEFKEYLNSIDDDVEVTVIDFHI